MIDIVIPLGSGSAHNNLELKYCLRSIKKHLTGYRNIYIIGDHPGFEGDFIHIPAADHGYNTQDNIRRKIEIACTMPEISENFFFTNDDHTYLKPLNVNELPFYYSGDLELAYKRKRRVGSYKTALESTIRVLEEKCYATYHFDIHVPIIYNKRLFLSVMAQYPWKTERWGFVIKSLYCNTAMINGVELADMQIAYQLEDKGQILHMIEGRFVFAYNTEGSNDMMFKFLEELFPDSK